MLTYPKCEVPKEEMLTHLLNLDPTPCYVCVAKELHEDGSPHLHALIVFEKKIEKKNAQTWLNYGSNVCNIQSARSSAKCYDYVRKDGDFVEHGNNYELRWSLLFDRDYEFTC